MTQEEKKAREEKIEEIGLRIRQLKRECFEAKIPMICIISYKEGERRKKERIVAEMISPAAVDYEPTSANASRIFYDLSNLLSGQFKTVPIEHIEGEGESYVDNE